MRKVLVALVVVFAAVALARADTDFEALLGPQIKALNSIRELSQQQNYDAIYDYLGSDYQHSIRREYFVTQSKKIGWKIGKLEYGTCDSMISFAWVPVRGVVKLESGYDVQFDRVAFFAKEKNEWKLTMFPFLLPPYLLDMGAEPRWLVEAEKQYGSEPSTAGK